MLGAGPKRDPLALMGSLRCMHPIQPDVWLGMMEEHLGWVFSKVDEDAELDGDQVAVAVGSGGRRLPVFMSAVTYIPGDLRDEHVARLKARIGAAYPAGAVLMFNKPVGWQPEQGPGGLLYGGMLWWDKAWSDFVPRPGGGLDDALAQRGRDLAHPDARIGGSVWHRRRARPSAQPYGLSGRAGAGRSGRPVSSLHWWRWPPHCSSRL